MDTILPLIGVITVVVGFIIGFIRAKTKSERIIYLLGLSIIIGFGIYGSIKMNKKSKLIANQRAEFIVTTPADKVEVQSTQTHP